MRVVVAPPEPTLCRNLREIIHDIVKILVHPILNRHETFDYFLAVDFKNGKIEKPVNESFLPLPWHRANNDAYVTKHYTQHQHGTKYTWVTNEEQTEAGIYSFRMLLLAETRKFYGCYHLNHRLNPVFKFWVMYTINRYWMAASLFRMRDSGLLRVWGKWKTMASLSIIQADHRATKKIFRKKGFK